MYPSLALPIARRRGHGEVVSRETDVVIEGFPRCASSFAVAAFRLAQEPRAVAIAHHTHVPAQVMAARRLRIPAIVLTREPEDAIVSHLIRNPGLAPAAAVRGYLRFYEPLLEHRRGFVVGRFRQVVSEFGSVIRRLNERFGTAFGEFEHTNENGSRVLEEIERDYGKRAGSKEELERIIPRPSESRDQMRDELRERYRAEASGQARDRAAAVYEVFAAAAKG